MQKSLAGNVVAKGVLNIFNALFPLVITPYVFHILGAVNIGNIEFATTIFNYFGALGLLGTYNYGLREISANRNNPDAVKYLYKNLFSIGLVSNLVFLCVYIAVIALFIHDPVVRTMSYIMCGNLVSQIFYVEWVNEAMEEFRFITIKTVVVRAVSLVFILAFVRNESDAFVYVWITVFVAVLNYLISYVYAVRNLHIPFREMFSNLDPRPFIVPLLTILVLNNTSVLYTAVDRTVLGYAKGTETVAFFSIGQRIVDLVKTLMLSVVFATLPRMSLYLRENRPLYQEGILKVMRFVLLMVIPTGIGLFMLSEDVIMIFGGSQYLEGIPAMRIFSIRIIVVCVESILYNQIIFLHGKEMRLLVYNLICGGLNLALNLVLLTFLSPFLSICITLLCELLFQWLCIQYIHNRLNLKIGIFRGYTLRYLAFSCVFVPIIYGVKMLALNSIITTVVSMAICASCYIGFLILSKDEAYGYIYAFVKSKLKI